MCIGGRVTRSVYVCRSTGVLVCALLGVCTCVYGEGAGLTEVSRWLVQNQVQKVREPDGQIMQK